MKGSDFIAGGVSFDPPGALRSPDTPNSPDDEDGSRKRKRSSVGTTNGGDKDTPSKQRHQPGVKRACNDCRQQKVRSVLTMQLNDAIILV